MANNYQYYISTKEKKAYQFWYKCSETARTEYVYIVAVSLKQAKYFFNKNFRDYYDFGSEPVDVKPLTENYATGTILGERAIL